jgi:phosphomannomutase
MARPGAALRISPAGLRGIVGHGLTAAHVLDFAAAFGTFVEGPRRVVIGRDPRVSSVMMREGVTGALLAAGHEVIDLGIVPTPVIQHTIRRLDAAGGVSIGASHNAAEWNALKFFTRGGSYLSSAQSEELLDIYHLRKFRFADHQGMGRRAEDGTATDAYLDALAAEFPLERLRRLRVLVDCTNGTSALILRRMIERFGMELILINEALEGRAFVHEPSTTKKMVELQLAPLVKTVGAQAGFLFDIDSDRVAFAAENGEAVSEELVQVVIADEMLERGRGRIVLTNVCSTALLEEVAQKHGGEVVRLAVGRQAMSDALAGYRMEQVAVAGEGTGAVMMPQFPYVYDGIAAMLRILERMERRGAALSELMAEYPAYTILKGKIGVRTRFVPELFDELEQRWPEARKDRRDGLRLDWDGRWVHVRVSQTEPVIRVICEQRGGAPRRLFDEVMDLVRRYSS